LIAAGGIAAADGSIRWRRLFVPAVNVFGRWRVRQLVRVRVRKRMMVVMLGRVHCPGWIARDNDGVGRLVGRQDFGARGLSGRSRDGVAVLLRTPSGIYNQL
jgi:hypothetical protein